MSAIISDSTAYLTTAHWADRVFITPRQARTHARRIPGAKLVGRDWLIPADAVKPERAKRGSLKRRYTK